MPLPLRSHAPHFAAAAPGRAPSPPISTSPWPPPHRVWLSTHATFHLTPPPHSLHAGTAAMRHPPPPRTGRCHRRPRRSARHRAHSRTAAAGRCSTTRPEDITGRGEKGCISALLLSEKGCMPNESLASSLADADFEGKEGELIEFEVRSSFRHAAFRRHARSEQSPHPHSLHRSLLKAPRVKFKLRPAPPGAFSASGRGPSGAAALVACPPCDLPNPSGGTGRR